MEKIPTELVNAGGVVGILLALSWLVIVISKYLVPLFKKKSDKLDLSQMGLAEAVQQLHQQQVKLETNHIAHIEEDIARIRKNISMIETEQQSQGRDIARIDERVKMNARSLETLRDYK